MVRKHTMLSVLSISALMMLGTCFSSFAADQEGNWKQAGNTWQYVSANGNVATDTWKKSGDYWFYLDTNGNMAKSQLIEYKGNYYYVNGDGVMSQNRWRLLTDDEGEQRWYYFSANGKAEKTKDKLTSSSLKPINGRKYAFDSEGRMLYGWVDADDPAVVDDADDGDWREFEYYFGDAEDGSAAEGWRQLTVTDKDGDDHDWWFYFQNGKKCTDAKKTINGRTYSFDKEDGHMLTEWAGATTSEITPDTEKVKYLDENGVQQKSKWFWAVPSENYLKEDYDEDEYSWWYAQSSGNIVKNQVKKISGKKYAFDAYGRMLTDFVQEQDGNVVSVAKAEDLDVDDLFKAQYNNLYYFSSDEEHDGAMKRGYVNIELNDDKHQFWFDNNGHGFTGYQKKIDKFTVSGVVLKAGMEDEDEDYAGVAVKPGAKKEEWEIADSFKGLAYGKELSNGTYVLVNKSGFVQTGKKNLHDSDADLYYSTDDAGYVTYVGTEKQK